MGGHGKDRPWARLAMSGLAMGWDGHRLIWSWAGLTMGWDCLGLGCRWVELPIGWAGHGLAGSELG